MRGILVIVTCAGLGLGCGSVVVPDDSAGAATGSGGAGGAGNGTAVASSASGVGGDFSTGTFTSTSGAGGSAACDDPTVFVDIEGDGALQHYDVSCAPLGYLNWPGGPVPPPGPPPQQLTYLQIIACPNLNAGSPISIGAGFMMWPGTATNASVSYFHGSTMYGESPATSGILDVTTLEMVGGVIEGTFTVTVAQTMSGGDPGAIKLTGKFRVCRGPDVIPV